MVVERIRWDSREAMVRLLQRTLDRLTATVAWGVLPLGALLCAQWPLRDVVAAGSRQANDLAQWIFALYVAVAIRHATQRRAHIAADAWAAGYAPATRDALRRFGLAACLLPWALFVLVDAAPATWRSIVGLEAFPETLNPLYFVIKASAWLLALLLALETLLGLAEPRGERPASTPSDP
jgi:TRAP-type C4-dicarboxylate transport system permease small subunit